MWCEADPQRRAAIIATAWSDDASYVDPMFSADGPAELDQLVRAVHERFPGLSFRLAGHIDTHHDRARWAWQFAGPGDSAPLASGVDFAELAPDGRLRKVTGFFDQIATDVAPASTGPARQAA
jgi:hypothetical protein